MATQSEIEQDQYKKLHELTKKVESLTGAVDVSNQMNIELIRLLKKALAYEFWVIIVLIAALVYGAIGRDGFYAVRQAIPVPNGMPVSNPVSDGMTILVPPPHDDLKNWNAHRNLEVGAVPTSV